MWPDSGESRGAKVERGRYPGVRGRGEERVHQSSPFCSKSRSRQRGGERRQVSPSHPFFLSPSPPLPAPSLSPHLPPGSGTSEAARAAQSPVQRNSAPTLSSRDLARNFPQEMPVLVPLLPTTLLSPASPTHTSLRGGISKIIVSGRRTSLFALSLPINVNNPLWHRVSVSFPSSGETLCKG